MARIFFVSRAFPPVLGGIENHNHELSRWLGRRVPVVLLANRHGKAAIAPFVAWAFLALLFRLRRGDVVLLGDGVLAPLGWLLRKLRRVTVVGIVHGLDVTYANSFYQRFWIGAFLPGLSGLIAVSQATRDEAIARGIPAQAVQVVPNGVDVAALRAPVAAGMQAQGLPAQAAGRTLLLTVGRLVRRKGVAWFVEQVLPGLPDSMLYVVAGDGPERERLERLIAEKGLRERVLLLGRVAEEQKRALLAAAALFIQPNIVVPGDVEGFGIAVIEAGACGTPVLAADLQGLRDSVLDGVTGVRLPPEDAAAWQAFLRDWSPSRLDRAQVAAATEQAFAWSSVADAYRDAILRIAQGDGQSPALSL